MSTLQEYVDHDIRFALDKFRGLCYREHHFELLRRLDFSDQTKARFQEASNERIDYQKELEVRYAGRET